ncbi:MAG: hypothetical protein J6W90_07345 [Verrucomicrobia bacterium]|nr:hypothetical protein [Verrucomicrobiota bacterium]
MKEFGKKLKTTFLYMNFFPFLDKKKISYTVFNREITFNFDPTKFGRKTLIASIAICILTLICSLVFLFFSFSVLADNRPETEIIRQAISSSPQLEKELGAPLQVSDTKTVSLVYSLDRKEGKETYAVKGNNGICRVVVNWVSSRHSDENFKIKEMLFITKDKRYLLDHE